MSEIKVIGQLTTRKHIIHLISEEAFEIPGILLPKGSNLKAVTRATYDKMKKPRKCLVEVDKWNHIVVVPLL